MSQPDLRDSQKSFLIATILDALSTFVRDTSRIVATEIFFLKWLRSG